MGTNPTTTRRAVLGALTILPAAAVAIVPTIARSAGLSPDFAAKVAAFHRASAEEADFDQRVYYPAWEAYERARVAVPHVEVGPHTYQPYRTVSTADAHEVKQARRRVREVREGRTYLETDRYPDPRAEFEQQEALAYAADRRDAEVARLNRRFRVDEYTDRSDALTEATEAAFNAVLEHPAASAADLAAKMELIDQRGGHEWSNAWEAMLADARRLAEREAA